MDQSKDELNSIISEQSNQIKLLENQLQDLDNTCKSLSKEKISLEESLLAFVKSQKNANSADSTSKVSPENSKLSALMDSLITLSNEKRSMEAIFQKEKNELRKEKEKQEKIIKLIKKQHNLELNDLKSKIIVERHDREKRQNEYENKIKEMKALLHKENQNKELEQAKMLEMSSMCDSEDETNCELGQEELTELENRFQTTLEKEKQRFKDLAIAHEQKVTNLENRLAELSGTIAEYHRIKQRDQLIISKLKSQIEKGDTQHDKILRRPSWADVDDNAIIEKIKELKTKLLALNKSVNICDIFCDNCTINLSNIGNKTVPLEEHLSLLQEYEKLKQKLKSDNDKNDEVNGLKEHIITLEEQIQSLNTQFENSANKQQQYQQELQQIRCEEISAREKDLNLQIESLEKQLNRQRDHSISLLTEKDDEINTLKTSLRMFLTEKNRSFYPNELGEVSELKQGYERPRMLHYAHEIGRLNVEVTNLRKQCHKLDSELHEAQRNFVADLLKKDEEIDSLKKDVNRFERSQSREGINLEYLKNVVVNYLTTDNHVHRSHMLNAIATVLEFNTTELNKIKTKNSRNVKS